MLFILPGLALQGFVGKSIQNVTWYFSQLMRGCDALLMPAVVGRKEPQCVIDYTAHVFESILLHWIKNR